MYRFTAKLEIIGVNPFVFVPENVLNSVLLQAGRDKGPIPIRGTINGVDYQQTLVRYRGDWRLYINTTMLKNSPKRIGEQVELTVSFDSADRSITPHPKLVEALRKNKAAKTKFDSFAPSLQKEIVRYIAYLKTEASVDRNVARAVDFLLGKGSFAGREKP